MVNKLKEEIEAGLIAQEAQRRFQLRVADRDITATKRAAKKHESQAIADEKWDIVYKSGIELIKRGQQGFDNWVAAMSQILIACMDIADAIAASDPIGSVAGSAYDTLLPIGYALSDQLNSSANDIIPQLPVLQHSVPFTADNKLDREAITKNLRRSDGQPLTQSQIIEFHAGINAWLQQKGYAPRPDGHHSIFFDPEGKQLTKAKFEQLRDDPVEGLNRFLSGHFEMDFEPTPSLSPR